MPVFERLRPRLYGGHIMARRPPSKLTHHSRVDGLPGGEGVVAMPHAPLRAREGGPGKAAEVTGNDRLPLHPEDVPNSSVWDIAECTAGAGLRVWRGGLADASCKGVA